MTDRIPGITPANPDAGPPRAPWRRRLVRAVGLFAFLPLGVVLLGLASCQGRLIYPGQHYAKEMWDRIPSNIEPLRYHTDQGDQVSYYLHPRDGAAVPERLWLVCGGNGSFALAWPDLLVAAPDPHAGYLLLDYPGYGFSEGSCTPGRILRASEAAVEALGSRLQLPRDQLDRRLGIFGHSLGAAVALQYAAVHPVRRIVLAAPFTTMVQMGHHQLFWPCGWLIWHRFDNEARLDEIAARPNRPPVDIVHGTMDEMIPLAMGRNLANAHPGWVDLHAIPGVDHDNVVIDALEYLAETGAK